MSQSSSDNKCFMVVKFLELPFMDEKNLYYCVHSSWIVHRTQEYVMVAFPLQNELSPSLFDMKYRQVRIGIMEYKTDKYKDGLKFIQDKKFGHQLKTALTSLQRLSETKLSK